MSLNYSWLNKAQINEYNDYLILLKEWFLFNLDFNKTKFGDFNTKNQLLTYLWEKFNIPQNSKNSESHIKNILYWVFKKLINFDFKENKITKQQAIDQILNELFLNSNNDNQLTTLILDMYNKASFLTRLDLMSLKWVSKEDFKSLILQELWIDENKKDNEKQALSTINKLFEYSINLMEKDLYLSIPKQYYWKSFKSLDDFVEYAFSTSNERKKWYLRVVDCAIIKTMSSYDQIMDNPIILDLNEKMKEIVNDIKNIPWLYIINEKDWEFEFNFNHPTWWVPNHARWKIVYRTKDDIKIILKLLYNRKYSKLDFFKDLLWLRVEVDDNKNWENSILLFKNIFSWNIEIDNKWFLKKEFIDHISDENNIKTRNRKPKAWVSEDFVNASLTWEKSSIPFEVQFVYANNKNESGYSKHEIYDLKKYISAISRLFWYITLEQIKILIHYFGLKSWLPEEWILYNLFKSKRWKKSFLMKANFPNCRWQQFYLSRDIYDEKLESLYKDDSIGYSEIMWRKWTQNFEDEFQKIYQKYKEIRI